MLGAISFITAESGHRYDKADLRLAQDLAYRAAVAIRNASLYLALQENDRRKRRVSWRRSLTTAPNPLAPDAQFVEI